MLHSQFIVFERQRKTSAAHNHGPIALRRHGRATLPAERITRLDRRTAFVARLRRHCFSFGIDRTQLVDTLLHDRIHWRNVGDGLSLRLFGDHFDRLSLRRFGFYFDRFLPRLAGDLRLAADHVGRNFEKTGSL